MISAYRRHDISDQIWSLLEPYLLGWPGSWGGIAQDNRRFINAVLWMLRTSVPWRDWLLDYGDWKNTHRQFCHWRDKSICQAWLEQWFDAHLIQSHPQAVGAVGGHQAMRCPKGLNTQRHLVLDAQGMLVRWFITAGTAELIEGIDAGCLWVDRANDPHALRHHCPLHGIELVIPAKGNRKEQRIYDAHLYCHSHWVEDACLWLKRWRGMATRHAKDTASFLRFAALLFGPTAYIDT